MRQHRLKSQHGSRYNGMHIIVPILGKSAAKDVCRKWIGTLSISRIQSHVRRSIDRVIGDLLATPGNRRFLGDNGK